MKNKSISLRKGEHLFHIKYEIGKEELVLDQLIAMVNDRKLKFDWFDAAIMAHEVSNNLFKEIKNKASNLYPQK